MPPISPLPLESIPHLLLTSRQSTTTSSPGDSSTSCSCPSSLSGGAIAGIVIGSIAGTLLLIWLWRTCATTTTTTAIQEAENSGVPVAVAGPAYPTNETTTHYRRRRRRSPGYYEYAEKPYARESRSGSVRRPRRVYLSS